MRPLTAALGFHDVSKVCMLQSYHQNGEQFEIMFNKTKYDALPEKMKSIIDMPWRRHRRTCHGRRSTATRKTTSRLQTKDKVKFYRTPDSVLQNQLKVYDQAAAKKSAENPLFKEVADSQRAVRRADGKVVPRHADQPHAWPITIISLRQPPSRPRRPKRASFL